MTARECEVIKLVAGGNSYKEIAHLLGISYKTVDVNIQNIRKKTGLSGIANITRFAIREGLISA